MHISQYIFNPKMGELRAIRQNNTVQIAIPSSSTTTLLLKALFQGVSIYGKVQKWKNKRQREATSGKTKNNLMVLWAWTRTSNLLLKSMKTIKFFRSARQLVETVNSLWGVAHVDFFTEVLLLFSHFVAISAGISCRFYRKRRYLLNFSFYSFLILKHSKEMRLHTAE